MVAIPVVANCAIGKFKWNIRPLTIKVNIWVATSLSKMLLPLHCCCNTANFWSSPSSPKSTNPVISPLNLSNTKSSLIFISSTASTTYLMKIYYVVSYSCIYNV